MSQLKSAAAGGPTGEVSFPSKLGFVAPLTAERLYRPADLSGVDFESTADLAAIVEPMGQRRALDAIDFGTQIDRPGFNVFAIV
jgi:hypothetical protein